MQILISIKASLLLLPYILIYIYKYIHMIPNYQGRFIIICWCLGLYKMGTPSPEEVVGLGQAAQYPVIPHDHYLGSEVSLLLGEGVWRCTGPCPPLQSCPPPSSPASTSSFKACLILQGVLHQDHTVLHRRFHLDASAPWQLHWLLLTSRRRFSVLLQYEMARKRLKAWKPKQVMHKDDQQSFSHWKEPCWWWIQLYCKWYIWEIKAVYSSYLLFCSDGALMLAVSSDDDKEASTLGGRSLSMPLSLDMMEKRISPAAMSEGSRSLGESPSSKSSCSSLMEYCSVKALDRTHLANSRPVKILTIHDLHADRGWHFH